MSSPEVQTQGDGLYLPGTLAEEWDSDAARQYGAAMLFREWLKEIDTRLDLVWAKEGSKNLQGGRWYIVRRNEDAPTTYWVVQDKHGNYAEPGPEHIEWLKRIDSSRHPGAWDRHRKYEEERIRKGEKLRAERHREFSERLNERIKSLTDTSVSMSGVTVPGAGGVILPPGVEDYAVKARAIADQPDVVPEADVDDALAGGGVDDFAVEDLELPRPNRAQRRAMAKKRNAALTKPRDRLG